MRMTSALETMNESRNVVKTILANLLVGEVAGGKDCINMPFSMRPYEPRQGLRVPADYHLRIVGLMNKQSWVA